MNSLVEFVSFQLIYIYEKHNNVFHIEQEKFTPNWTILYSSGVLNEFIILTQKKSNDHA